jgi:predicted HicB family RNase H-like nuclease
MKKKNIKPHPYVMIVEWSDEDQLWIGCCPELFFGGVHGKDREKVYAELCRAVDEHIEIAKSDNAPLPPALAGKEFSGKFILQTTPEHHQLLALRALQTGDSLNNYVVKKLKSAL